MLYSIFMKLSDKWKSEPEHRSEQISQIIQVEVLNGCGVSGLAERFTDFLRNRKIDVVSMGNYKSFEIDKSFVIDRIGNLSNAYKVAELLNIKKENVIQQINEEYFLDVSIVIGRDFNELKPLN